MEQLEPISRMVAELSHLPGIGQKTAQRLAYHIASMPLEEVRNLATALWQGRKSIRYCEVCGNYTVSEQCEICSRSERHNGQICVVRDPRDVIAMERMHDYHGLYHVLHGTLSPLDGIGPNDIHIKELMDRIEKEPPDEIILATSPDIEGEATATYLARLIKPKGIRVTRLAHGLPVGLDIEYADEVTLSKAMSGRTAM